MNNSYDKLTKSYSNHIINHIPYNKEETGVTDTGEIRHYFKYNYPHFPSTNMGPPIHVVFKNVQNIQLGNPVH